MKGHGKYNTGGKETQMSKPRKVWGTNTKWYTIVHRRSYERNCYSFGYRTEDIGMLREIALGEAKDGAYSCVKIINADTNEDVEYFTKAKR